MKKLTRKKLYIQTGLQHEYSGKVRTSLKIYMISLKTFYLKSKINSRLFCCCHWVNLLKKRSLNLIKLNYLINWFNLDTISFLHKYYQYTGQFSLSLDLIERYASFTGQKFLKNNGSFNKFNFNIYIFNNTTRLLILVKNKLSKILNISKIFHKIRNNIDSSKTGFWITCRILIHFKTKFKGINKFENLSLNCKRLREKNEIPRIIELLAYSEKHISTVQKIYKLIEQFITSDIKFYLSQLKKNSFLRSPVLGEFSILINMFRKFLNLVDSYSNFNRNLKNKLIFIIKLQKKACDFEVQKLMVKMINYIVSFNKRNPTELYKFLQIQQKLGIRKNTPNPLLFIPTVKIEKKLINLNKEIIIKLNLTTEESYEKKKINTLLKISLMLILTNFKLSVLFRSGGNYKKLIFGEDPVKKVLFNKQNTSKSENVNIITNENFHLLYKILIHRVLKRKSTQKKFLSDKILESVITSKIFAKFNQTHLKPTFIILAIKKKKYVKAYNLLRLYCSNTPNSVQSWQLLSLVEKEIGISVSKTLRFTLRIIKKFPDSLPGIIFAGNLCSIFGSNGYALAEFFQAYRWKNNSPFLNLSISIQYLNGSINRLIRSKGRAILLCLCFFFRYKILRYFIIHIILQKNCYTDSLYLEILYNSGRILLFMGLNSGAKLNFESLINHKKTISKTRKFNRDRKKYIKSIITKESLLNSFLLDECTETGTNFFNEEI